MQSLSQGERQGSRPTQHHKEQGGVRVGGSREALVDTSMRKRNVGAKVKEEEGWKIRGRETEAESKGGGARVQTAPGSRSSSHKQQKTQHHWRLLPPRASLLSGR